MSAKSLIMCFMFLIAINQAQANFQIMYFLTCGLWICSYFGSKFLGVFGNASAASNSMEVTISFAHQKLFSGTVYAA